jgi:hypothetical protein
MRWGVLLGAAVLIDVLALAACDELERDTPARYYVPPDATDLEEDPAPGTRPTADAAKQEAGDATTDGPPANLDLSLTGWWRGSYTASPWAGTQSAGASATQNLTQATNPPLAGPPLNGFTTADFNGTSSTFDGAPVATFHSTTTFSGWALVHVDSINTDSATWSQNDAIVCTNGTGQFGIYLRDNGAGVVTVGLAILSTVDRTVTTTFVKNSWQLVQWKSDGATMSIRVNGSAWASTTAGSLGSLAAALDVGRNPGQNNFLDGRVAEIGLAAVQLTEAQFDAVRTYASARYGLTL